MTVSASWQVSWLRWLISPMIAVPPSAVAIGILFLLAPSGWLMRLVSLWLTGFEQPAGFAFAPDQNGASLIFALLSKEIPSSCWSALPHGNLAARRIIATGAGLGHGRSAACLLLVLPSLSAHGLPLAAVMIFSLSVVDMPRILGPSLPAPLAVLAVEAFEDADLAQRFPAAFAACMQIAVTFIALAVWRGGEIMTSRLMRTAQRRGRRLRQISWVLTPLATLAALPVFAGFAGLIAAAIWSLAGRWFFPDPLPADFTLRFWERAADLAPMTANSILIATAASGLAVTLTLMLIAHGGRWRQLVYAPLLVPQVSFVLGVQMVLTMLWLDGSWLAMIWIMLCSSFRSAG